ncbi:MAG: YbhB/YbcL family Raf kinase inhibitor-like protein [Acidimicrobiales bacterium]
MSDIEVTSGQFEHDGELPASAAHQSTGGQNRSPQLSWGEVPEGTRSLAVTCYDPDAPTTVGFTHWVRFGIPPTVRSLDEGSGTESGQWTDGFSDWGDHQYGGMAPPAGDPPHHYHFAVYALDSETLGLDENTSYAKFRFLIRGHVLATGAITGLYAVPG